MWLFPLIIWDLVLPHFREGLAVQTVANFIFSRDIELGVVAIITTKVELLTIVDNPGSVLQDTASADANRSRRMSVSRRVQ